MILVAGGENYDVIAQLHRICGWPPVIVSAFVV